MNAQKQLLKAGGSILALTSLLSKFRAKFNEEGNIKAKQSYSKTATVKKQNSELAKKQIEVIEQKEIAKEAPKAFGIEALIDEGHDEQKIAEKKVQGFGELVSTEKSETKIPANDPDVQGLIEVKQKSLARQLSGKQASDKQAKLMEAYAKSHGGNYDSKAAKKYLEEFGYSDISSADFKRVGWDKHDFQMEALHAEDDDWQDNGWGGKVQNLLKPIREKYKNDKAAQEYLDYKEQELGPLVGEYENEANVSWDGYNEKIREIIDDFKTGKYKELSQELNKEYAENSEEKPIVGEWYNTFSRENSSMSDTYKVWQDESEEELPTVSRDFSGFVF